MHQLPCDEVKVLNVLLNSKQSSTEVSSKKHTAVLTVSLLHGDTEEKCTTAAVKGEKHKSAASTRFYPADLC